MGSGDNHKHDNTSRLPDYIVSPKLNPRSSANLFELCRHFARHDSATISVASLLELAEDRRLPVWRFVEHDGVAGLRNLVQCTTPVAAAPRKETEKREAVEIESRGDKRGQQRGRAG